MSNQIQFILIDPEDRQSVFATYFSQFANWTFYQGQLSDLQHYDCLVTPGNSFGDMSGGFDICVIDLLGSELQDRIFERLKEKFPAHGDRLDSWDGANQPIGTSLLIQTLSRNEAMPVYLCHTPTMEFARRIQGRPNIYMAMNSILFELLKHNQSCLKLHDPVLTKIETVVLPFLGTGFGELSYEEASSQMTSAYQFFKVNYPYYFG